MNDKYYDIREILMELGEKNPTATAISYMMQNNPVKSTELEKKVGLRQPEVSIIMKDLKGRGWIDESKEMLEGKGRPVNIYRLNKSPKDIINFLESKITADSEKSLAAIERLRATTGSGEL